MLISQSKQQYIRKIIKTRDLDLKEPVIRLYPLPCFHVGAAQSDVIFIRQHVKRIQEDPNAIWIYLGDGGECVTKLSKGSIYDQLYSPQEQLEILEELLAPIKDKGWAGIRGNHGYRIYKETGISFDSALCVSLGIPYMDAQTWAHLRVNRSDYNLYFHHGVDSGITSQAKLNSAEKFTKYIDVDALFTAHSHVGLELPPAALLRVSNVKMKVETKLRHQYICGSGYDSRTGYAAEKGYPPLLPQFIVVEFSGRTIHGYPIINQKYTRYISEGQHEVTGVYNYRSGAR